VTTASAFRSCLAALALLVAGSAQAGICIDEETRLRGMEDRGLGGIRDPIFVGRVVRLVGATAIDVDVTEVLQGSASGFVRLDFRAVEFCAPLFVEGGSAIFFASPDDRLAGCSTFSPRTLTVARLRRILSATSFPLPPGTPQMQACRRLADARAVWSKSLLDAALRAGSSATRSEATTEALHREHERHRVWGNALAEEETR
jgi:hypothetical protein